MVLAKDGYLKQIRSKWALEWPGQTILCISKLYWTADVTEVLSKMNLMDLNNYIDHCTNELNEIVKLVRGTLSIQNRITLGTKKFKISLPLREIYTYIWLIQLIHNRFQRRWSRWMSTAEMS